MSDLGRLLDGLDELLRRYVAFPFDEARWATAAWAAHTWLIDSFESTPRLAVLSPEPGSGKTRTLEVLEMVTPSPLFTVNVSAAALFRKVAEGRCTLLLDEADTYLGPKVAQQHEDLRGLVNAGHRRGAVAYRCVVDRGVKVEEFPAFAPVAIAGIGNLPDTILTRSIVIPMKKRAPHEIVAPFRRREVQQCTHDLVIELERWGNEYEFTTFPVMPEGLVDRAADVWEPLVMIGDAAGEPWRTRLRTAATKINQLRIERDPSLGVRLLHDCREVIADSVIATEDLLVALVSLDEAPWGNLRGEPLDARGLARFLKPYGVHSEQIKSINRKGYRRADFEDPWDRYLSPPDIAKPAKPGKPEAPEVSEVSDVSQFQQGNGTLDVDDYERDYPDLFESTP